MRKKLLEIVSLHKDCGIKGSIAVSCTNRMGISDLIKIIVDLAKNPHCTWFFPFF